MVSHNVSQDAAVACCQTCLPTGRYDRREVKGLSTVNVHLRSVLFLWFEPLRRAITGSGTKHGFVYLMPLRAQGSPLCSRSGVHRRTRQLRSKHYCTQL